MTKQKLTPISVSLLGLLLLLASLVLFNQTAAAQGSPLHPTFPLLDDLGENVRSSGNPISTMTTCGGCHDTEFISSHSFHVSAGLESYGQPVTGRAWDTSGGIFGKWDPLFYRYLTPPGDGRPDLTIPDWIKTLGFQHVGGGPGLVNPDGLPLTDFSPGQTNFEASILDPATGDLLSWDWAASGTVEMNCFLCHISGSNNAARISALNMGNFKWANTATLLDTGIVEQDGEGYQYLSSAFNENGDLIEGSLQVQDPTNENCGQCHGLVHDDLVEPVLTASCRPDARTTVTTGQIISPQKLMDSGMNLTNKQDLNRSWDIHAERLVSCTDCHFSLNNPVYYQEDEGSLPGHLTFDPRRLELGEYLYQPNHQIARGQSAESTISPELKDTMRRCESCHDATGSHTWLPYLDQHLETISCETCHIPKLYAPAIAQYDWTVLQLDGEPHTDCRGIEHDGHTVNSPVIGYEPILLSKLNVDGDVQLAPYNLIATWYWITGEGENTRPVRTIDLEAVFFDGNQYDPEVLAIFDQDRDGELVHSEQIIDTPEKEALITKPLLDLGLTSPRITGEIQPYSINHDIATGEWAIKECQTCHSEESRVTQAMVLAEYVPGGVVPEFVESTNTVFEGDLWIDEVGALVYAPRMEGDDLYILGNDSVSWVDWFGVILFVGTWVGIVAHGGTRLYIARRTARQPYTIRKVYMYSVYERLWHWLQTFAILLLIGTGLIIHKPEMFGAFSFRNAVLVHNVLAAILVINAALSLFYHLVSGEIKQYIPRPRGFFDQAITQTQYYLRGIFRKEAHPFEKNRGRKLNPLQQLTYFVILNVLLPLQIITGGLMWGVQRWPELAGRLGGLPFLAPFHSLVAWTFATFIVAHVYLTTTGHQPTAAIRAMMYGWDELEEHADQTEDPILPVPEEATI